MQSLTRRSLICKSTAALGGGLVASSLSGLERIEEVESAANDDTRRQRLIQRAIDSAMSAGAVYADARLSFTREVALPIIPHTASLGFGVRAFFDGYWGFSSSPVWDEREADRLGKAATDNAKVNVLGKPRESLLAANGSSGSGNWSMPVIADPFDIPEEELADIRGGCGLYQTRQKVPGPNTKRWLPSETTVERFWKL